MKQAQEEDGTKPLRSKRHEAFCLAYVGEHRENATASCIAAGYKARNAKSTGSRMLTFVDVQRRIRHLEDELVEQERLKAIDAVRHLKRIATVSLSDFVGPDGRIDVAKLRDPQLSQAVAEITPIYDKDGCLLDYKLKLKDSMKALELLGLTDQPQNGPQNQILVIKV